MKNILKNRKTRNRIIIFLSFAFFIFNQYYSIYFRNCGHAGPTGLDDSDFYISRIAYFKNHALFSLPDFALNPDFYSFYENDPFVLFDFHGIVSSFIYGKLAALFDIRAENMFYYNFYIGIFLMGLVLLLILRQLGNSPWTIACGMFLFAFYTGQGAYHGFYWVTPSFYCTMFLMLLVWIFYFRERWFLYSIPVIFLLLFSHPSSPFCIFALFSAMIFYGVINRREFFPYLKKALFLLCFSMILYILYGVLYENRIIMKVFKGFHFYKYIFSEKFVLSLYASEPSSILSLSAINNVLSSGGQALVRELPAQYEHDALSSVKGFFSGVYVLWTQTPFKIYFLYFLPLSGCTVWKCWRNKKFKVLSVFLLFLVGMLSFSLLSYLGRRTFLYTEVFLLVLISYSLSSSLVYFFRMFRLISGRGHSVLKANGRFFVNLIIIVFSFVLFLYLLYSRLSMDFCQKFFFQRYFDAEGMESFLAGDKSKNIILLRKSYEGAPVLSLNGGWRQNIYPINTYILINKDLDFYKKALILGENRRIYKRGAVSGKRNGIKVFFPACSEIVFETEDLVPGDYRVEFYDDAVPAEAINNISIGYEDSEGIFRKCRQITGWTQEKQDIKIPFEKRKSLFLLPWYYLAQKYIMAKKPDYFTVRKVNSYSMNIKIPGKAGSIYLKNNGPNIFILPNIKMTLLAGRKKLFEQSVDSCDNINNTAYMIYKNEEYPLLWNNPQRRYHLAVSFSDGRTGKKSGKPLFMVLKRDFGDFKIFSLFDRTMDFYNKLNLEEGNPDVRNNGNSK